MEFFINYPLGIRCDKSWADSFVMRAIRTSFALRFSGWESCSVAVGDDLKTSCCA